MLFRKGLKQFGYIAFGAILIGGSASAARASAITSVVAGTTVNPVEVNVVLTPGDSLTVPITVTSQPLSATTLDLFLVQDLSGSFNDDIATMRSLATSMANSIRAQIPDTNFGIGSFVDKPVSPFGSIATGDYEYQTDLAITSSISAFQNSVNALTTKWGGDFEESQLTALLQTALRAETEIGFRANSRRVAVLTTDAGYHEAGDFAAAAPNNLDDILDGSPAGTAEDYPEVGQVAQKLIDADIVPIFAVTQNQLSTYENLVDDIGVGEVVILSSDSSNLVSAILDGLAGIAGDIDAFVEGDEFGFVTSLLPTSFDDVPPGEARTFNLELLWDGVSGTDDSLDLSFLGIGSTQVNITLQSAAVSAPPGIGLLAVGVLLLLARLRISRPA